MKRISTLLLTIVIAATLLAGCQMTPENPVVIQKDTEQLLNAANSNEKNNTIAEMLNAPDRLVLTATDGSGNVTVNADAEIRIPDAQGIPTTRVQKRSFTQEDANKVLAYFIGDGEFNNRYAAGYDENVEKLIRWKAELAKETDPEKRAGLQASIDKFESAGISQSGGPQEIKPAPKIFTPGDYGGDRITGYSKDGRSNRYLEMVNNPQQNKYTILYTCEQNGYAQGQGSYWYENQKENTYKAGVDLADVAQMQLVLTKEEAMSKAREALVALGLDDRFLSTCDEVWGGTGLKGGIVELQGHHAYQLRYVRAVNGVPITYTDNNISSNAWSGDETTGEKLIASWPYETVQFIIDDTGIIEFSWESPYEIAETVTGSSALKPFDAIEDVFSKMILITKAYPDQEVTLTFDINKAQLGLMRIMEKNNPGTALLVPVWDFYGTMTMEYTDQNGNKQSDTIDEPHTSHLTINAIDGSIIDRQQGY